MKAIVIYDTRFGNTEKVAKSLEIGLKEAAGIQAAICMNARDVSVDSLIEYDLICIGAPTEGFTASRSIKEFLARLKAVKLAGKYGFAFDTKLDSRLSGSAAKYIEKELINRGFKIIVPRQSAIVFAIKERGAIVDAKLKEGEDKNFEQTGVRIGARSIQLGKTAEIDN
jgi:flavodoxin